ncbi:MAG TPA: RNA-binding cell elongation regulator Jag/EloR [Actinomycetota bacterium]|nr:RNA-binding cell elongation regulator Jag/EloR [Actinomycetota bacterium]
MTEFSTLDPEESAVEQTSSAPPRSDDEAATEAEAIDTVGSPAPATSESGLPQGTDADEASGDQAADDRQREPAPPEREPPPPPEEVAATAKEFLSGLIEAMGLEAEISTSVSDSGATLDVSGEAMGVLIGRRGQTLDALQEIARTAVQRRLRARVRLVVDVEGYRARRRESLADYARSMAERAKARGTEIELEPMSAYERKVVHDAVGEIEGASSYSEGEEPNRKVIIRGE